jgi:hypothetical protein
MNRPGTGSDADGNCRYLPSLPAVGPQQYVPDCIGQASLHPDQDPRCPALPLRSLALPTTSCSSNTGGTHRRPLAAEAG